MPNLVSCQRQEAVGKEGKRQLNHRTVGGRDGAPGARGPWLSSWMSGDTGPPGIREAELGFREGPWLTSSQAWGHLSQFSGVLPGFLPSF